MSDTSVKREYGTEQRSRKVFTIFLSFKSNLILKKKASAGKGSKLNLENVFVEAGGDPEVNFL